MSRLNRPAPLFACIAALSLSLVLVACGDNPGNGDEPTATPTPTPPHTPTPAVTPTPEPVYDVEAARAELAAARALWESKGSDHYTIEYDDVRYPLGVPARLTVRNGVIESATFLDGRDSGMPVPPDRIRRVLTIDGMLDKIEEVLSDPPAWNMGAEYDAELGYPRDFGVSYRNIPDDYFAATICCYKPLAPSPPTVAPATSTLSLDDVAKLTPIPTVSPTPVTPTPTLDTLAPAPAFDFEAARAEFAAARALWKVGGSTDYELESLVLCECPENNRPLKITVRKGVIESIIDLESGKAITRYISAYTSAFTYKTIRGRFDQIGRALRDPFGAYYLRAEYHPELGYPTYLEIDYQYGLTEDDFTLERLIYRPLDPSPPRETSTLSLDTEGRRASVLGLFSGGDAMFSIGPAATVEEVLERGLRLAGASPVHQASLVRTVSEAESTLAR